MDNIKEIFTNEIKLPQNNMREHIDRDSIFELAEDIKKNTRRVEKRKQLCLVFQQNLL